MVAKLLDFSMDECWCRCNKWFVFLMGSRLGCYKTMCTDWDPHKQETSYSNKLWKDEFEGYDEPLCRQNIFDTGNALRNQLDLSKQ